MVQYLSEEWAKEVDAALAASDEVAQVTAGENFVMQQVIADAPGMGEVTYHVAINDGDIAVGLGPHAEPTVTVSSSYDIAVAVNRGDKSPPSVLMTGKAKVDGNLRTLMAKQKLMAAIGEVLQEVPTDY